MTVSALLGVIAAAIGSVMALSPLLQARAMRNSGSSRDVSLGALWIFAANCVAWLAYGASMGSLVLVVPNGIALATLVVAICVAIGYRHGETPTVISSPVT